MPTADQLTQARRVVAGYCVAAAATGAIPIPAASAAIVGETAAMLAHLSGVLGAPITWSTVLESMGFAATLNVLGRQVFIEGAKLLGWGAAGPLAAVALSGLGATTAGVQTYIIGLLAIEIGKNDGRAITAVAAHKVIEEGKSSYHEFVREWKASEGASAVEKE